MKRILLCAFVGAAGLTLSACKQPFNDLPEFVRGDIQHTRYDGVTDDLLTAGLGASGLASTPAPAFVDPLNPEPAELVDTVPGGGFGTFFGPQVGVGGEGLIPGDEYIAFMSVPGTEVPVTVMAQVPDSFDPEQPCMVTAPSSGSRGIY
ncbi:3-hydroxybutyrate oligomer hydrolase family protein, partial [Marinobacter sp.]|uniref:3-hydroxybutyrate oligomer hydrolase family protein n=1 Tax=Marinobacter sp. TaxID=50741 RepID=UPI0035C6BB0D